MQLVANKSTLPAERVGYEASPALRARRDALAGAIAQGVWRTVPAPQEIKVGGVRALQFDPPGTVLGVLIHLHGGAFRIGAPELVAPFAAAIAKCCALTVVCPAYRLAPEHPFPSPLVDAINVVEGLANESSLPLFLSGDSAGGGLAASVAARLSRQHRRLCGLVLLSAWLDLTVTSESFTLNAATDTLFSRSAALEAAELYLQGTTARHPSASPLFGPLERFPPTLINVGEGEVLVNDSKKLHAKLQAAWIDSRLDIIPNMEHVAVTRNMLLPGAIDTFSIIAEFINARLSGVS
jgi:epsilon-lactone hydrolase